MLCENCGSPINRVEAEHGLCTHCGAILPHVLRAAEKAELVRRAVEQGHDVTVEGDRIEIEGDRGGPPKGQTPQPQVARWGIYFAAIALTAVGLALSTYENVTKPPPTQTIPLIESDRTARVPRDPMAALPPVPTVAAHPPDPLSIARPDDKPSGLPVANAKSTRTSVDAIVQAHKAQYDRCQHAELTQNPSAARRYSVAITVGPDGRTEWIQVLSEAGPIMKSCIGDVTKGLAFPKPSGGSTRSIFTLSFVEKP